MKAFPEWTRRDFLKTALSGVLGASGLIPFSRMADALGIESVSTFAGLPLDAFPTSCHLCNARCGILGFLQNNRLRGILGNPKDPNSRGRICIRGLSGVNLQDDEERILQPMARKGKRGEGKWKPITWDEAFSHLSVVLNPSRVAGTVQKPIIFEMGRQELLTRRFLTFLGTRHEIVYLNDAKSWNAEWAHRLTWGVGQGIPDLLRARTILNFGGNPLSHHDLYVPFLQRLIEATTKTGARLISFDVRLSETAGLSDEWFPLAPGTDGLVALTMAHVIVEQGLHDREFIERWTNCSEERLRHELSPYSPKRAEKDSGIAADDLRRIALEFARTKPSVAFAGGGVSRHINGIQAERAVILLNAVVGNIDRPGGYGIPKFYAFDEPDLTGIQQPQIREVEAPKAFLEMMDGSLKPETYFTYMANPLYALPQTEDVRKILNSEEAIPNLIVMDTHMNETAAEADMILPAATYLESWGIDSRPSMEQVPFIGLRQPILTPMAEVKKLRTARGARFDRHIVKPMGKALSWNDLVLDIAGRTGGNLAKNFPFRNVENYVGRLLAQIPSLMDQGGPEYLKKNGIWFDSSERPNYRSYVSGGFRTGSGRLEIISKNVEKSGSGDFPSYVPLDKESGLTLIPFKGVSSEGPPNAKWLCELNHDNPVWINHKTAESLNIEDGDRIEISSQGTKITARVRTTQGIHPGVVAVARGLGHSGFGHYAKASPFKGIDTDSHLIWWKKHGNGIHIEPIIQLRLDPTSGGQAWMDTVVKITKA
jgi:anaerobic selenocysteine-containing dehydrogenase